jgi:cysteine desulfurase/selenocysteine lyase
MEALHADEITRIANRIYNELPGAELNPAGSADSLGIARELLARVREDVAAAPPYPASGEALPDEVGGNAALEQINRVFESLKDRDHLPLETLPLGGSAPLGYHAENLVRQQTYRETPEKYGGLKGFVERIQSCGRTPEGSGYGESGIPDPFSLLLKASLPANGKLEANPVFNVDAIRRDFPVLHQQINGRALVWFDNAATTQKPKVVIDTLSRYYSNDNSNIHRGAHTLAARSTDAFEGARDKVRDYLNAGDSSEIIFVRGTTEGINLVAQTFGRKFIGQGDEIVLSELEHHANIVPWQIIARERGAVLRVIPVNERSEVILEEYERLLGPRTRLVALTHANNSLGTVLPIHEMTRTAKRYGATVLIDGAQSVAHLPVDVQALDCDFFVFSGHKIFGPTGIGAVYGRKELLEILPPWQGGGNMIRDVTFEETTYNESPAKFEAGTPNIADAVGLGVALDYVRNVGLENIAGYEHKLLEYATEKLLGIDGLRLVGTAREKVAVTSFILKDKPVEEVGRYLDQHGIAVRAGHHCAQPSLRRFGLETTVRPSFSFYNTFEEIDRLVHALKGIR